MPYSARTCGGGGPGGGPGGFFPGGKRGTPGTVANTGPDDERGPLLRDARKENYISTDLSSRFSSGLFADSYTAQSLPKSGTLLQYGRRLSPW